MGSSCGLWFGYSVGHGARKKKVKAGGNVVLFSNLNAVIDEMIRYVDLHDGSGPR